MQTKKAISDIVSTVLIIMIAVAAVGIIGSIVVPMVRESLQGGTACLAALTDVSIVAQGTCINKEAKYCSNGSLIYNATNVGGECHLANNIGVNETYAESPVVYVQVSKGADASVDLARLNIQVLDESGNSKGHLIENINMSLGDIKIFPIHNVSATATTITLAPIVSLGNSYKQCDASTSAVVLVDCK